jgi:hypothetical protein
MVDRSIHTRKALVHSIPISEVKDMKSNVLRALKGFLFEKNFQPFLWAQFKQFSRKKNCMDFEFLLATFPPLGLKRNRNSLAIPFFLSSHTHSY